MSNAASWWVLGTCLFSSSLMMTQDKAPAGPAGKIVWQRDYKAALELAKSEKKPLLVAFIMDDEPANDETVKKHYQDPDVVKLAHRMVCLIGCIGQHAATGECPKFGSITCAEHQDVEKKARAALMKTDVVRAPQHVFLSPAGVEVLRKVYLISKQELGKAMAVALSGTTTEGVVEAVVAEERTRVDQLLKDANSKNAEVRDAAFAGLARSDDARAIPALIEKVKKIDDESARCAAIRALGVKGNFAAVQPLLPFLGDKSTRVYIGAIRSLLTIELPEATPALFNMLKKERNDRPRGWLLRATAKCLPESPEVQKACLQAIKEGSVQMQEMALIATFSLKPDPKIVEAVKPLLASKKENTRGLAAWVLGKQRVAATIPLLEKMEKEDKLDNLKALATKAIAYAKGQDSEEYEKLGGAFRYDEDF